ncbi:unnamed protein product [Arabis nemorensis]|uniref:Late embryogenesis abundant protein LEA-2 subgroup domain-containing protein n=1 Tax=Arabis nemorensis TaxID=586526 RepID=A0A565CBY0_9BRAS|nr:unnamed protein product [Arabis nemorensis]
MDKQNIIEEVNQRLLINVTDTEVVPELRSISSNDQESESANFSRWSLFYKICLAITTVGALIALLSLIICITPTPPTVHVHSMQISFAGHNLPIWSAKFSIKNPNGNIHVKYENPSVWVFHRKRLVWTVEVGSFGQKGGEENEVVVKGDKTGVIDEEAARELEEEVAVTGGVVGHIDMVFLGRVWFYPGASIWGKQNMTAVCENVRAKLTSNDDKIYGSNRSGLSFDGRRDCSVRLPMFP